MAGVRMIYTHDPRVPHGWPAEPDQEPPTVDKAQGRVLFAFAIFVGLVMVVTAGVLLWMAEHEAAKEWWLR